jgi:hypothetical protein
MKNKNISVISDSISMPRFEEPGEKILLEQTWPVLLSKLFSNDVNIYNFSLRARDSFSLSKHLIEESVKLVEPQAIILQVGIVDCSPRIFSNLEKRIIFSHWFPKIFRQIIITKRKNKLANSKKKNQYTTIITKIDFKENITSFIDNIRSINKNLKIIILPIIGDLNKLEKFRGGYTKNIKEYNEILNLESKYDVIYLSKIFHDMDSDWFYNDWYHLSKIGHEKTAKILYNYLNV